MQLAEHTSKLLLRRFGLPTPSGALASSLDGAFRAADEIGYPIALKAQVPMGGRGKAGGIRRVNSASELAESYSAVLAAVIGDFRAEYLLIEPWRSIDRELYVAITMMPEFSTPVILISFAGGVDVESSDAELFRIPLTAGWRSPDSRVRRALEGGALDRRAVEEVVLVLRAMARAFAAYDATLIELNPLAIVDGQAVALDARLIVDDAALKRQPEIVELAEGLPPLSTEYRIRRAHNLEYVRLGGAIGLISGGAGMTMAAMDEIQSQGSQPSCFLDCSANPTRDGYGAALDILESDFAVRSILISVFGGGTQVDRVARTVVSLIKERGVKKPVTMRMKGSNEELAAEILRDSGIPHADSLKESVTLAINAMEQR